MHIIKCRLSLTQQSNVSEQNVPVFDLRLTPLFIHWNAIAPLDKIALAEHASNYIQSAWCDKTFIGKDNFDL